MKIYSVVLLLMTGLFFSCGDNDSECQGLVTGPDFVVPDETKAYISNYTDKSKVIFFDLALNQEVEFTIDTLHQFNSSYSGIGPCPEDPTVLSSINGNTEVIKLALGNADLDKSIVYVMSEFPDSFSLPDSVAAGVQEILLQYGTIDDSPTTGENLMLLDLDVMSFHTTIPELLIGPSLMFNDVICINVQNPGLTLSPDPSIAIKLTRDEGIVYIEDYINDRQLVYLRVE